MQTLYQDQRVWVCVKPAGVLSTDEPGGMPDLLRRELGDEKACIRTVHRLDRAVGGVMVFARSRMAAGILSEQVRDHTFQKTYLAVLSGVPAQKEGTLRDWLGYDTQRRMAYVADAPGKDVREAVLSYRVLAEKEGRCLVEVKLHTGRTHQIRIQFAARGLPLAGDRKYGPDDGQRSFPALWSRTVAFRHPQSGEEMTFSALPERVLPWSAFFSLFEDRIS